MREPKNQMLGTMVPLLMQLSVNEATRKEKKKYSFYVVVLIPDYIMIICN